MVHRCGTDRALSALAFLTKLRGTETLNTDDTGIIL